MGHFLSPIHMPFDLMTKMSVNEITDAQSLVFYHLNRCHLGLLLRFLCNKR